MYALEEISLSAETWDATIQRYKTKHLFHESSWLTYLERAHNGRRVLLAIQDGNTHLGYFCGLAIRKGPFQILGSPLRGWWTPYMGPIVNEFDEAGFLLALEKYCRTRGIDYVELCYPGFEGDRMRAAGYKAENDSTFFVPLGSREEMWRRINQKARNKIRQAERKGVQIEIATNISVMVEYYDQLKAVFARQFRTPPHSRELVLALWQSLYPKGQLLVLRAMHDNRCIATYVGAHDERVLFGLGWASWPDCNHLRPNDLIQWNALMLAAERGLGLYDMCGGGSFKPKFGGTEAPRIRWHKAHSKSAALARALYKAYWFGRRGILRRLRQAQGEGRLAPTRARRTS